MAIEIKHAREIKVGLLAIVCLCLLYFGFNFLKGVNIFSSTLSYHGKFVSINGLEEQAPVKIKGLKVGQVDHIHYDFSRDTSFVIDISIKKDIALPHGTEMALVADGLLGGMAIELRVPVAEESVPRYQEKDYLPTVIVPGLMDNIQKEMLGSVQEVVDEAKTLVAHINDQMAGDHLQHSLTNIDKISTDLTTTSADLKVLMHKQVPSIVNRLDTTMEDVQTFMAKTRKVDLEATVRSVDSTINNVNALVTDARSPEGTLGKLLTDEQLYNTVNNAVVSVDSLLTDFKAHPKRYINVTIFGGRKKSNEE